MSAPTTAQPFAVPRLSVRPWADPVIDDLGYDLRSAYVETFWLGILGPSTTLLLRRIAADLDRHPDGFELDLADTAGAIGLAARGGRSSPFMRALVRSTKFGLARLHRDSIDVRRKVPPLNLAQVARLPETLQAQHHEWLSCERAPTTPADARNRARRLALSLLEADTPVDAVEHQLHRWQMHPAMAHDALRWALDLRDRAIAAGPDAA
ncbi:MAG: hypothetical protein ACXIVQ_02250 [Acidimicrobiales bacterium]